VAGYPATNTLTSRQSEVCRVNSTSAGGGYYVGRLLYALAADVRVNMVAVARTNLTNAGYMQAIVQTAAAGTLFSANTAGLGAGDSELDVMSDVTARSINNHAVYSGTIYTTARNIYIDLLTDVGLGMVEHARAFAGVYHQLTLNFDWNYAVEWIDRGRTEKTYGGDAVASYGGARYRRLTLPFAMIPDADKDYLFDLMRTVGTEGELFISLWPGSGGRRERDNQMWCRIESTEALKNPMLARHSGGITFIEC
jgi:hypothetical protein